MATLKVALTGCGYFGRFHLHSWLALADAGVELVAVCDADAAKAQATAAEFGIPGWHTEYSKMLAVEQPDIVDIVTQMQTHRVLVEQAMAARVATVVQKPLAPNWIDCLAMANSAKASGTFLAVHENFRFQAPIRRIREIVAAGMIGTPSWARIAFRTGVDVYASQPYFRDEERLVILDLGIHLLDVARALFGEVERVSCETQRRNANVRAEDTATIMLRHVSGLVCLVECTYENRRSQRMETLVEIEGECGGITLLPDGIVEITTNTECWRETVQPPDLQWINPPLHFVQGSVFETCKHMAESIRGGHDAQTSVNDNLKTYALVEAAYRAAETNRSVRPAL